MTMTKKEVFDIMASDMKLWDAAKTDPHPDGSISKTLDLPFGIGPHTVTLEGLTDAQKKRDAVTTFATYIRGLIKERIDDEAVTARAAASAARREQADSADSIRGGTEGVSGARSQETANAGAGEAHKTSAGGSIGSREEFIARRSTLTKAAKDLNDRLAEVMKELRFIDRVCKIMEEDYDTPEDSGETQERQARKSPDTPQGEPGE